jgi:uncharacterized membrane protein
MEAFSDGVFAIAITILVLEIAVPAGSESDLLAAIRHEWPSYLAYVVSFATIGAAWISHTTITEHLERADSVFLRLNLLLLLVVSFLPFPTALLSEYTESRNAERVAVTFYGVTLFVMALATTALWHYAARGSLLREGLSDDERSDLTTWLSPSLGFYLGAIAIGLLAPVAAVVLYFAIALYLLVPAGTIRALVRRSRSERRTLNC